MSDKLGRLSYDTQKVYYMDPSLTWEERLARAYDEAATHVRASMMPGQKLNLAKYAFAADVAGNQFNTHAEAWENSLREYRDSSLQSAVRWTPEESQEYYLGHFGQAAENLGVFISGHARKQVDLGALSPQDFEQACDLRLRAFSDIIHAGRTGALEPLLNAQGWNTKTGASQDGQIIIATGGQGSPNQPMQGLGFGWVAVGIVAVVAVLVGAGIGVAVMMSAENAKQRRAALDICQNAVERGHPDASQICSKAFETIDKLADKSSILDNLMPAGLQKQIVTYGALGIGVMLLINFLPNIVGSVSMAQDRYATEKYKRLKRLEDEFA